MNAVCYLCSIWKNGLKCISSRRSKSMFFELSFKNGTKQVFAWKWVTDLLVDMTPRSLFHEKNFFTSFLMLNSKKILLTHLEIKKFFIRKNFFFFNFFLNYFFKLESHVLSRLVTVLLRFVTNCHNMSSFITAPLIILPC